MRAGRLDRRVVIEVRSVARDATGQEVETWSPAKTVWMGKRDVRANERWGAQQVVAEIDAVFTARWRPGDVRLSTDNHRLVYAGRVYNILGITELGRRGGIEIACAGRGEAGAVSPADG